MVEFIISYPKNSIILIVIIPASRHLSVQYKAVESRIEIEQYV